MTPEGFMRGIDRRTFLRILSMTGAAGLILPRDLLSLTAPLDLSRVVLIEDSGATSGTDINGSVAQSMMNCAVMRLTEIYDVGEAWKSLFPDIGLSSVIGIKVNCINSAVPTHPEVTATVTEGLSQMMFGGTPFPENNIIVFDRRNGELQSAGYTLNTSTTGVRCFGTNNAGVGYSTETYDVDDVSQKLSRIVTEMADYLVNISVLKNHGTAGVTLCLKNHYGTCNGPGSLHGNDCDPYIPALNALSPIKGKQCINICDALLGVYSGGPGGSPQFAANTIIMSQDIVAADYWGREILADNGCSTIGSAHHIDTAAQSPYSLGTNDPGQMDVVNIANPAGVDPSDTTGAQQDGFVLRQNNPNPFASQTRIRFYAPKPEHVTLTVFDTQGRRVRRLLDQTVRPGWHETPWEGRNDNGRRVAGGIYLCRLRSNGTEKAIMMQALR
jgi:uncharacterized protein (DUF362 family)